jgi:hypothetical protein
MTIKRIGYVYGNRYFAGEIIERNTPAGNEYTFTYKVIAQSPGSQELKRIVAQRITFRLSALQKNRPAKKVQNRNRSRL